MHGNGDILRFAGLPWRTDPRYRGRAYGAHCAARSQPSQPFQGRRRAARLATIFVGDDPNSATYEKRKAEPAFAIGMNLKSIDLLEIGRASPSCLAS
jgi:hypothetical protein